MTKYELTFNILSLTMMENVVYEINEMKAKLKSHVFLRHSLKEVVGEHLTGEMNELHKDNRTLHSERYFWLV